MVRWEKVRVSLLAIAFGIILIVVMKVGFTSPSSYNAPEGSAALSTVIPLPGWQFLGSYPLSAPSNQVRLFLEGKRYQYHQRDRLLTIEMRYFGYDNLADVRLLIREYADIASSLELRQYPGIGHYGLLVDRGQAYLSACIPPRGPSTVTSTQFNQNLYLHNMRFNHLLLWLLGQTTLRDDRCLWAHLSIPVRNTSSEETYKVLEKAWYSWYQWWTSHFPDAESSTAL
jgi:cyanosortase A-associated protein